MKAGFHSPLPPVRSGVADLSAVLLESLRHYGPIEVDARNAAIHLYHLGNNQIHREIYRRALDQPGVVVLHDAVLQHFFLGSLDENAYVDEFVYNYGEWYRDLARELWRRRASSGVNSLYYQYPMLKRIVERSRAVIVHNPAAVEMVRAHSTTTPVVEIPHLFQAPALPSLSETLRLRQRLGIGAAAFVFGIFGFLRESKRLLPVLRAFQAVRRARPDTILLVAGEFASADLARLAARYIEQPGIVRAGYLPENDFWRFAALADACINLRYPTAGETSGISIRMMGIGKLAILSDVLEISRYPETACFRIEPGVAEEAALIDHMLLAVVSTEMAREVGRRAADHIALHHSSERVAKLYWDTLCAYRG